MRMMAAIAKIPIILLRLDPPHTIFKQIQFLSPMQENPLKLNNIFLHITVDLLLLRDLTLDNLNFRFVPILVPTLFLSLGSIVQLVQVSVDVLYEIAVVGFRLQVLQ